MTSERVERTWICTGGYGRFRGEWVKKRSEYKLSYENTVEFYHNSVMEV